MQADYQRKTDNMTTEERKAVFQYWCNQCKKKRKA